MWIAVLLALQTVGAAGGGGAAQDPSATTLVVDVAGHLYGPAGPSGSSAGNSGPDGASGYIWSDQTLCTTGASDREMSFTPAAGWHYTAKMMQRTGDEFMVQVSWQRLWEKSTRPAAPRTGDVQVKLRQGDWLELDRVDAVTPGVCQAVSFRLEVTVRPRSVFKGMPMSPGSTSVSGAGGGGRTGGGGAGGAGAGGGGGGGYRPGVGVVASGQGAAGGGRGGGGVGRVSGAAPVDLSSYSVLRSMDAGARPIDVLVGPTVQSDEDLRVKLTALLLILRAQAERASVDSSVVARLDELSQIISKPRFDAEVWLVHRLPNGTEEVQRQAARFASRSEIAFAPVAIATARGAVNIDVTAVLQISTAASQPLSVRISRRIKGDGPPPVDNAGGSNRLMDLPKPDEVLSFELPALVGPSTYLLTGHAFSLRLRMGPQSALPTVR